MYQKLIIIYTEDPWMILEYFSNGSLLQFLIVSLV